MSIMRLQPELQAALACPRCHQTSLRIEAEQIVCTSKDCAGVYPLVDRCPIMINDDSSAFRIDDYVSRRKTTGEVSSPEPSKRSLTQVLRRVLARLTPSISRGVSDYPSSEALTWVKEQRGGNLRILVIGAGERVLSLDAAHTVVYTDVDLGPMTHVICDGHDIAFADGTFDVVLCLSVLEHVADPYRCAEEIHRVLKDDGFVYATTPFMQQVHMGRYDFTRFTHLGHRRLFRRFDEIKSGVSNGPGMVLAWSIERFVSGFARTATMRSILRTLARMIAFPFTYFDPVLARRPAAYDNASAYYFFGSKRDGVLSDRELVRHYRGVID